MTMWADNVKFVKDILDSKYQKIDSAVLEFTESSEALQKDVNCNKSKEHFLTAIRTLELMQTTEIEMLLETIISEMHGKEKEMLESEAKEKVAEQRINAELEKGFEERLKVEREKAARARKARGEVDAHRVRIDDLTHIVPSYIVDAPSAEGLPLDPAILARVPAGPRAGPGRAARSLLHLLGALAGGDLGLGPGDLLLVVEGVLVQRGEVPGDRLAVADLLRHARVELLRQLHEGALDVLLAGHGPAGRYVHALGELVGAALRDLRHLGARGRELPLLGEQAR